MGSASDKATPVALVTGASGFTGRYVSSALEAAGYAVRGLSGEGGSQKSVDLSNRVEVLDAIARLQPDVVVHLAAIAFVGHEDVDDTYRVNIMGTRHLLEGLAASPVAPRHVVLASSANVYGNASGVVAEDAAVSPQNDYAVSKLAMEYMARLWTTRLPITIVRPFNYTGVGQSEKFLIPKIVSHFRRKAAVIELGNLDVWRDFYDVRHVATAYCKLVGLEADSEVYNICSGQEYSLRQVIEMMTEISGHHIDVRVNPDLVRLNEVKRLRGDSRKLSARIGGLPEFSLRDTLRWMYEQ